MPFDGRKEMRHTIRVAHDDVDGQAWAKELVGRVGRAIKEAREGRSAGWLSDRTAELGYRISPTVIAKLDSGHRGAVLSVPELIVLAAALDVSPVTLVYPGPYGDPVEVLPGRTISEFHATQWFSGIEWSEEVTTITGDLGLQWVATTNRLRQWRRLAELELARSRVRARKEFERDRDEIEMYDKMIRELRQQLGTSEDA